MSSHRMAYVVPTKDRPDDLEKLLASLSKQTRMPAQIIIVDASEPPVKYVCDRWDGLAITYVREFPPSLARQRNAGMEALQDDITVAGYLDDDLELEPDATEQMLAFWDGAPADVGGAAFSILNQPKRRGGLGFITDMFLLNSSQQGKVLSSSFCASIGTPEQDIRTDWLYGGATLWRRDVIERYRYDEWYIGHGYLEDLDFSYRVSRDHRLWVVAAARVWHWHRPVMLSRQYGLGVQQVVNRFYFYRKIGSFSSLSLGWALLGQCLLNIALSVVQRDSAGLRRFAGNLKGMADVLRGRMASVEGIWK